MSAIPIAIFIYGVFAFSPQDQIIGFNLWTIGACVVTLLMAVFMHLWSPKKGVFWASLTVFFCIAISSVWLVLESGGLHSPYIAAYFLIAVFSGIFGLFGIVPFFVTANFYLVWGYIQGLFPPQSLFLTAVAVELPLILSYVLWHQNHTNLKDSGQQAYDDLAKELSSVANKSELVIGAIADGVLAIDKNGTIQLINPAAQQLLGWGKHDAISLNYKSVLKIRDKTGKEIVDEKNPVAAAMGTNQETRSENYYIATNSEKTFLASLLISPVGQIGQGVIVVFRDITKEKQEEREQAEFISTASHEMRTPVASIEGYLGLALNPATANIDAKARDFITKAHESAEHLGRLFQDLLDTTKAEDGRLSNNPKVVDIVPFIHDIAEGLITKAENKGLNLYFKPVLNDDEATERRLSPVYYSHVDNDHLREITQNLIENAIKYTPNGEVVVDIVGDVDHIVISVQDSGIGIPTEDMSHLFQKFYRVDNSDTREIGGTGLGLYLCRRLAETIGGRIWCESEYKKGSTFFVQIPRITHEKAMQLLDQAAEMKESSTTFQQSSELYSNEYLQEQEVQNVVDQVAGEFDMSMGQTIVAKNEEAQAIPVDDLFSHVAPPPQLSVTPPVAAPDTPQHYSPQQTDVPAQTTAQIVDPSRQGSISMEAFQSLSAIEKNPEAYTRRQAATPRTPEITIPQRDIPPSQ